MKRRPIFIVPAIFFAVTSLLLASLPGGAVGYYLIGAATCLIAIGFSSGWPKYIGIALCLGFLAIASVDSQNGRDWERKRAEKLKLHEQQAEQGGGGN